MEGLGEGDGGRDNWALDEMCEKRIHFKKKSKQNHYWQIVTFHLVFI